MPEDSESFVRRRFIVQGIVQGVGFRPFVYGLALRWGLGGLVLNDSRGVVVEVEGLPERVTAFEQALRDEAPPLARIDAVITEEIAPRGEATFSIAATQGSAGGSAQIPPDVATCDECLRDILDPDDRHYAYAFTNCTNCGPRFTIIENVPYDRSATTMREFPLCEACQAEYNDPLSRRFFAQPTACPLCGPQVRLIDAHARVLSVDDPIAVAAARLAEGSLLAIKELGGYALVCDATDEVAMERLQPYKNHASWTYPLLIPDLDVASQLCELTDPERAALQSRQRPVVLVRHSKDFPLARNVASPQGILGLLFPYSPLQRLLLRAYAAAIGPERPVVLAMCRSSAAGEPLVYQDAVARERLVPVADATLTHNRAINVPCDDSVIRIVHGDAQLLRRSRGYVPQSIELPVASPLPVLSFGGGNEVTLCFVRGRQAFPSQPLGDLVHLQTRELAESVTSGITHFQRLFGHPEVVAYDLATPGLPSAPEFDATIGRKIGVAHQHAHVASVLAEHARDKAVIGIVADSPNLGADGTLWGCEILIADLLEFERQAHLGQVPVPASSDTRRQPWQMAAAYLKHTYDDAVASGDIPIARALAGSHPEGLVQDATLGMDLIASSSLASLFDAAAALLGLEHDVSPDDWFEGRGVAQLEAVAATGLKPYSVPVSMRSAETLAVDPLIRAIVSDLEHGVQIPEIAGRFHSTIAQMLAASTRQVGKKSELKTVVLSGDVFQNRLLLEDLIGRLETLDFEVLINRQVPPTDEGISLGQAAVVAAWLQHHGDVERITPQ